LTNEYPSFFIHTGANRIDFMLALVVTWRQGVGAVKAIGYCRVSTEEQAVRGVSLADQEERLRAYCAAAGLELAGVIREEGVSGGRPLASRPGGAELLRLVRAGIVGHVVAVKLDRLFRDAGDCLAQTKAWDRAGMALHLIDLGGQAVNTASAMGRFFMSTMAACAELEKNLTGERTAAALAHKKRHRQAYAPTPYGFDRVGSELIPNRTEQGTVATIRTMRDDGASLRAIAKRLNADGIPTKTGKHWRAGTVHYILGNELYAEEIAVCAT
jgi:DNA invertase Pin-like site-specific DNA recombinase